MTTVGIAFACAVLVVGSFGKDAVDFLIDFQFGLQERHDASITFHEAIPARAVSSLRSIPGVEEVETSRSVPVRIVHGQFSRETAIEGLGERRELFRLLDARGHEVALPPEGLVLSSSLAGILKVRPGDLVQVEVLDYERPMTRVDSRTGELYLTSGHFVWVGERTRRLDGAHIDFVASVRNPVGVKVSADAETDDLLRIIDKVDPEREPGRLTFITRMGAGRIREALPTVVEKVTASGASVTWVCDPMHGNTYESASGYKTRDFDDVVEEVEGIFEVHRALGTVPGGIHVELTGNDVTECIGGSEKILDADLNLRYESVCDPRLNHQQSLELAFLVAEMLNED